MRGIHGRRRRVASIESHEPSEHSQKRSVRTMTERVRRRTMLDVLLTIKPVFDVLLGTDEDSPVSRVHDAPLVVHKVFDAIHTASAPARKRKASGANRSADVRNRGRLARTAASSEVPIAPFYGRKGSPQASSEL